MGGRGKRYGDRGKMGGVWVGDGGGNVALGKIVMIAMVEMRGEVMELIR